MKITNLFKKSIKIFLVLSLTSTFVMADKCQDLLKNKALYKKIVACDNINEYQLIQYLSKDAGVSVALHKGEKAITNLTGFGEYPKSFKLKLKSEKKQVKSAVISYSDSRHSYIFRSYYGPIEGIYILDLDTSKKEPTLLESHIIAKDGEDNNLIPVKSSTQVLLENHKIKIDDRVFHIQSKKTLQIK
ncbi:hypothetical protein [Bacteriovorax sp. DB6_IX]|uniref:hypothetical protein n=2 Tax=Bacteriovorax sp. DB6_IX TaxID=1353530 RepID=UPI00038A0331|nr:hypothetical protein [Bacteriovorax sp. DB6_IX]EQC52602.1 hypothetical protein M901_0122 [Bacteriovorax sp. DB6_IX]